MEPAPTQNVTTAKESYGSVLSILLIVLVLVMGAFYVWNKRIAQDRPQNASESLPAAAATAEVMLPITE